MRNLKIDHITFASTELVQLETFFSSAGLDTVYGGIHSNQVTHMSILGFEDGSYIELISTINKGEESPLWNRYITGNAGFCAWAVEVDNVFEEAQKASSLGIPVKTVYMNRKRPDGQLAEWDLAFLGDGEPGTLLPFVIKDRTDRNLRVVPTPSVTGSELKGIAKVVIAVADLYKSVELFQKLYGWTEIEEAKNDCAKLINFKNSPLLLASPTNNSWLKEKVDCYGSIPCAAIIGSRDLEITASRLLICKQEIFFGRKVLWLDTEKLSQIRVGYTEV